MRVRQLKIRNFRGVSRDAGRGVQGRELTITAVLTEISEEARNRFHLHLRPWDEAMVEFADETGGPVTSTAVWALPVTFIGRDDREEDDFVGNTFFEHPAPSPATPEDNTMNETDARDLARRVLEARKVTRTDTMPWTRGER